jgi:hypothetical protein
LSWTVALLLAEWWLERRTYPADRDTPRLVGVSAVANLQVGVEIHLVRSPFHPAGLRDHRRRQPPDPLPVMRRGLAAPAGLHALGMALLRE